MGFNIGAITGTLELNTARWDQAMSRAKRDSKSFEGAILRNDAAMRRLGATFMIVGTAITALNTKMIILAAGVEESENLFEVSMGNMADAARKWSDELSDGLGLNEYEIRRTVGTLNVMIKSMGFGEKAAYDMSTSLIKLSQDMASFYNLTPEDMFEKIKSGLVGMARPLRDLGILVNENVIKNWALTNGLIKQGKEMTDQQKVIARYAVIFEATTAAQGDLLRTIASTTNQYRIFTASLKELGATMGNTLLPLANAVLTTLNKLIDVMGAFIEKFPTLSGAILVSTAVVGALLIPLGGLLILLPGIAAAALAMGTTIGVALAGTAIIIGGIAAAAVGVYVAIKNWDTLKAIFYAFSEGVNRALSNIMNSIATLMKRAAELSPVMKEQFEKLANSFQASAASFAGSAALMNAKGVEVQQSLLTGAKEFEVETKAINDSIAQNTESMWKSIAASAGSALDSAEKKQKHWLEEMKESFDVYEEMGKRTFNLIADTFSSTLYDMTFGLATFQEAVVDFGKNVIKVLFDIMAQWVAMKIITGIGGAIMGTPAIAGAGGYGAGTPSGVMDMGSWSKLPSADTGMDYVPYDMIARVHKGEKITTAQENNGSSGVIQLTLHNNITPEAIAAGMQSREGEGVIINTIDRDSLRNGVTRREITRR